MKRIKGSLHLESFLKILKIEIKYIFYRKKNINARLSYQSILGMFRSNDGSQRQWLDQRDKY